jgi:hypothetical protein
VRLSQSGDTLLHFSRTQIDYFNGMFAGGSREEVFSLQVDCEVIKFARYAWQSNRPL